MKSYTTFIRTLALSFAIASFSVLSTGCKTTNPNTGELVSNWDDPAFVTKTAFFVKLTVANGVAVAITEDSNAESYCILVKETILKITKGKDYTPGAFEYALKQIPVKELSGKYAGLFIANVSLAYELYWGEIVVSSVNKNEVALKLLTAIVEGIDLGVAGNPPPVVDKPQNPRKSYYRR